MLLQISRGMKPNLEAYKGCIVSCQKDKKHQQVREGFPLPARADVGCHVAAADHACAGGWRWVSRGVGQEATRSTITGACLADSMGTGGATLPFPVVNRVGRRI